VTRRSLEALWGGKVTQMVWRRLGHGLGQIRLAVKDRHEDIALAHAQELLRLTSDAMPEGFAICRVKVDGAGRLTHVRFERVNAAFLSLLGTGPDPTGCELDKVMPPADFDWMAACQDVFESRIPQRVDCKNLFGNGPCELVFAAAEPDRLTVMIIDRTQAWLEERRHADRLAELNHRTKNSLANVASVLRLQAGRSQDPEVRQQLLKACHRIDAVSQVHDSLYQAQEGETVDLGGYLAELCERLHKAFGGDRRVEMDLQTVSVRGVIEHTLPLGIIVNELVTNAVKYAYPSGGPGAIHVGLKQAGDGLLLTVGDDGCGLPDNLRSGGLGLQLVRSLVRQLGGTFAVRKPARGVQFEIHVPAPGGHAPGGQDRLL
jgi:two-component sensor histidine kinase